jgi:hypothetical protein
MVKSQKAVLLVGTLAALSIVLYVGGSVINQAAFADASAKSDIVARNANANGDVMKSCKQIRTAQDCATGPTANGPFTSGLAHEEHGQ